MEVHPKLDLEQIKAILAASALVTSWQVLVRRQIALWIKSAVNFSDLLMSKHTPKPARMVSPDQKKNDQAQNGSHPGKLP